MSHRMIRRSSPAKVNLYLHVTGKRTDGYHLLDSLTTFIQGVEDCITLEAAHVFSFHVTGPFAGKFSPKDLSAGKDSSNLVVKAAHAFASLSGIEPDVSITLEKNIPPGAGLGGGSGDAATTFRGLEEFYGTNIDAGKRDAALLTLGADVPVCYKGVACRFEGIGEIMSACPPMPKAPLLLLWPNIPSITKDVFTKLSPEERTPRATLPDAFQTIDSLIDFLQTTDNTLTRSAIDGCPAIADTLSALSVQKDCLFARMSGSGSCVFGLFETASACEDALSALKDRHPDWWIVRGTL